jgi:acyl-CoA thioester hydrolase
MRIVVSEAHLDSFGHLNNARYLELFEQARWELITARGFGMDVIRKTQTGPTILAVEMRFLRELVPREAIVIATDLSSYERKVGKLVQRMIKSDGALACEAIFTFGLFDLARRKLIEPTPEWAYAVGVPGARQTAGAQGRDDSSGTASSTTSSAGATNDVVGPTVG